MIAHDSRVERDEVPGLLAYRDGRPVGWVSVAPRNGFERIVGDPDAALREEMAEPAASPVWSITCFYIDRDHRGSGVASALLAAAIDQATTQGVRTIEAYPVEPERRMDDAGAFTGLRSMFAKAGFREVGRFDRWRAVPTASQAGARPLARPPGRPIMRLAVRARSTNAGRSTGAPLRSRSR